MKKLNKLILVYRKCGADLYGSICPVLKMGKQEMSVPFVISKTLGNKEIVYGSMIDLVAKINNLMIRYSKDQLQVQDFIDRKNIKPIEKNSHTDGVVNILPEFEGIDLFLHELEEKCEEVIFLITVYLRSLIEVFGREIDEGLSIYNYDGRDSSNTITVRELSNIFMHNRYLVIRGEYLMDVFSDKKQLQSGKYFDSKIRVLEYFAATKKIIEKNITLSTFLDMIELRLDKVSAQSDPQEIIFLVQNIHSLNKIVESKMHDKRFSEMVNLIFKKTIDSTIKRALIQYPDHDELPIRFTFTPPKFKIAEDLSSKKIEVFTTTNGTQEKLELEYKELFSVLRQNFGQDPLITFEKQ